MTRTRTLPEALSDDDVRALLQGQAGKKPSKFQSEKVEIDGYLFDSKREAIRYNQLKLRRLAGEIDHLTPHQVFDLEVNGIKVGRYTADFTYIENAGPNKDLLIVEDVKSSGTIKTEAFRLRARLFHAVTGYQITCVDGRGKVLAVLPKLPKPKAQPKPRTPKRKETR